MIDDIPERHLRTLGLGRAQVEAFADADDRLLSATCWSCDVGVGEPHLSGCELSPCGCTGTLHSDDDRGCQRPGCEPVVFTGTWPGVLECIAYGMLLPHGLPDVGRLLAEGAWDRDRAVWTHPDAPDPALRAPRRSSHDG